MIYAFKRDAERFRGRILEFPSSPASDFITAGFGFLAFGAAALFPLIAYYGVNRRPPGWEATLYWGMVIAGFVPAVVCFIASRVLRNTHRNARELLVAEFDHMTFDVSTTASGGQHQQAKQPQHTPQSQA
jgi:hypothetical protein